MIYNGLLATPPPFAGHDFTTISPVIANFRGAPTKFVDPKASWYHVTQTCRQIYLESRPIFFAAKAYYAANPQDLQHFRWLPRSVFCFDNVTSLCVKNLVVTRPLYTKACIDNILSNTRHHQFVRQIRQTLEAATYKSLELTAPCSLKHMHNLRTVNLCMLVGEEMRYVDYLYGVTGMQRGIVEFVDASHWLIRPQNPEDVWSIQYACSFHGDWGKGENGEDIPYDMLHLQKLTTDIDSRAPELKEGDERYVEVQIQWPADATLHPDPLPSNRGKRDEETTSGHNGMNLFHPRSPEVQPEVSQNLLGDNAQATSESDNLLDEAEPIQPEVSQNLLEDNAQATSESENLLDAPEPDLDQLDEPLMLMVNIEENSTSQERNDLNQGEKNDIHLAVGELSSRRPSTQSGHQAQSNSLSGSSAPARHATPMFAEDVQTFLLDSGDKDSQVQTTTSVADHAAKGVETQHQGEAFAGSGKKPEKVQQNPKDRLRRRIRRMNAEDQSSSSRPSPLDTLNTKNPYTEEEMKSYEQWQQRNISGTPRPNVKDSSKGGKQSPPSAKAHEKPAQNPVMASTTATTQAQHPLTASRETLGLIVRSVQAGALFLLFLLIVVIPEKLSGGNRKRQGASQQ